MVCRPAPQDPPGLHHHQLRRRGDWAAAGGQGNWRCSDAANVSNDPGPQEEAVRTCVIEAATTKSGCLERCNMPVEFLPRYTGL